MTVSDAGPGAGGPRPHPHDAGEAALELLGRQLALYQELEELSRRQPGLIESDDTDGLLALLAQRQAVIDRLGELNAELGPIRAEWPRLSRTLTERDRDACRETIDGIAGLAQVIAERDALDRSTLERRRSAVASELSSLSAGRSAVGAYGPRRADAPRYQDREA